MKLASEATAGLWVPLVPSLDALLARLESLSLEPGVAAQRQIALRLALQPYLRAVRERCCPRSRRKRN
jgi:hypothetical protein